MKKLLNLDNFLYKIFYPTIEIYNHSTKSYSPLYLDNGEEVPHDGGDELIFDTSIKINGKTFEQNKTYLYKLKEKTLDEIENYCKEEKKAEIKEYLAQIHLNLPLKKDYFSMVAIQFKLTKVADEMKSVVDENGSEILLEEKHYKIINEFKKLCWDFYTEVFDSYRKFYEHYHDRLSVKSVVNGITQNSIKSNTFKLTSDIPESDYSRVYFYLNNNLIETSLNIFREAFSGNHVKEPLKIKWLLTYQKLANKRALLYFLESDLFEHVENDQILLNKIKHVFADNKRNPLEGRLDENLRQFNRDREKIDSKPPKWKKQIDQIVSDILTR